MSSGPVLEELLKVGLTAEPEPIPFFTDEPKLPVYQARIGGTDGEGRASAIGQGVDTDPQVAKVKAVAEALERLCLFDPLRSGFRKARFGELDDQIDPADFHCYSSSQVADRDAELQEIRAAKLEWAPARDRLSGREVLVPRQLVYLDTARREPLRIRRESISSGAALGRAGAEEAFSRGLFELIERDAFIAAWLKNQEPPRLMGFEGAIANLIALLDRYRLDCRVFDTRGGLGAPSVVALTVDRSGVGPAVTAGIAAAETYEDAVRAAVLESVGQRRAFRLLALSEDIAEPGEEPDIVSADSRIAFWSSLNRLADLPTWWDASSTVSMASLDSKACPLADVLDNLSSRGFQVLESDITKPEIASQGFEVVRVTAPELHPLYVSEDAKALRSEHWGEIDEVQNVLPHPFA